MADTDTDTDGGSVYGDDTGSAQLLSQLESSWATMMDGDDDGEVAVDDMGIAAPPEEDGPRERMVSERDGAQMIDEARGPASERARRKEAPEAEGADENEDEGDEGDEAPRRAAKPETTPDERRAKFDATLDGLPADVRDAVRSEIQQRDAALAPISSRPEIMQAFGGDAGAVVRRMAELHDFAARKPADYIGWMATQAGAMAGEDGKPLGAAGMLQQAAKALGLEIDVRQAGAEEGGGDDDDMFADPETLQLRARVRELEARNAAPVQIGPDAPVEVATRAVTTWAAGKNADALRLVPQIAPTFAAKLGRELKTDDLDALYETALSAVRAMPGAAAGDAPPSASAPAPARSNANADAVERARRASKPHDGSSPRAGRPPVRSGVSQQRPRSVEEDLRAAWSRLSN